MLPQEAAERFCHALAAAGCTQPFSEHIDVSLAALDVSLESLARPQSHADTVLESWPRSQEVDAAATAEKLIAFNIVVALSSAEADKPSYASWQRQLRQLLDEAVDPQAAMALWRHQVDATRLSVADKKAPAVIEKPCLDPVAATGSQTAKQMAEQNLEAAHRTLALGHAFGALQMVRVSSEQVVAELSARAAGMQLRLDARHVHHATAAHLGEPAFPAWPRFRRIARLSAELAKLVALPVQDGRNQNSGAVRHARTGGPHLVVDCDDIDDVLGTLLLARCQQGRDEAFLRVAPLCRGIKTFERAGATLAALFEHEGYRAHLKGQGNLQHVVLDAAASLATDGICATAWALQQARRTLDAAAEAFSIDMRISFGGEPLSGLMRFDDAASVLATPPGCEGVFVSMELSPTQAALRLDSPGHASQFFKALARAQLAVSTRPQVPTERSFFEAMALAAGASKVAFQALELASSTERLRRDWAMAFGDTRPAGLLSGWLTTRSLLPGWFGLSDGLLAVRQQYGVAHLRRMYRQWPFFTGFIDHAAKTLSLIELSTAQNYAQQLSLLAPPQWASVATAYAASQALVEELREPSKKASQASAVDDALRCAEPLLRAAHREHLTLLETWQHAGLPAHGPQVASLMRLGRQLHVTLERLLLL